MRLIFLLAAIAFPALTFALPITKEVLSSHLVSHFEDGEEVYSTDYKFRLKKQRSKSGFALVGNDKFCGLFVRVELSKLKKGTPLYCCVEDLFDDSCYSSHIWVVEAKKRMFLVFFDDAEAFLAVRKVRDGEYDASWVLLAKEEEEE